MSGFTFDQLEAFVAVVKKGSFSAAARSLNKDRSTVHQLVAYLEIDWNVTLFDRSSKFPQLKPEAKRLLQYAESFLAQRQEVQYIVDGLSRDLGAQELVVSYDPLMPRSLIIEAKRHIAQHYSRAAVHWLAQTKDVAIQALSAQQADLSLQFTTPRSKPVQGLSGINIGSLGFATYVTKGSALLQSQPCPLAIMQQQMSLVPESYMLAGLETMATYTSKMQRIGDVHLLVETLGDIAGSWAILPLSTAAPFVERGLIEACEVEYLVSPTAWPVTLVLRESSRDNVLNMAARNALIEGVKATI
ncbi:LysR family transcriptional regulator [Thaumasiovibrio subtropicus]|uniref:LysR family transcriptional regulator n=1 Tax=Thaumasiovibrio subtropicus TaxID=1891207 RepID=UPI00131BDDCD|nr:LysR family transcriptional regulator [Thaumasiovibrio subtropicus]